MIIDTSALIAIIQGESEADRFALAIAEASSVSLSAASYLELFIVTEARNVSHRAEALVEAAGVVVAPVTAQQALLAREAHRRFGGGKHGLNFGDCFAYALSRATGEPLLFKGDGFARADVLSAS